MLQVSVRWNILMLGRGHSLLFQIKKLRGVNHNQRLHHVFEISDKLGFNLM